MKKLTTSLIVLLSFSAFSQSKDIEIIADRGDNSVTFFGKNNTNTSQQITLTLKQLEGLDGYTEPIQKDVPAGAKMKFAELTIKTEGYMYGTAYTNEPSHLAKEKALTIKRLKKEKNIREGIVIFNKTGCSRCSRTTGYLTDNNIEFRVLSTKERENKILMTQLLRENGIFKSVLMPVMLIDGKLANNQGNLDEFLETLN